MRTIYVLAGLLLSSFSALAQEAKKPAAADEKNVVTATLPGEEKLTPQQRAERDFIMPVRRKQAAILQAAAQAEAATEEMLARNFIGPEEVKVEEAVAPVAKPAARTRRRRPVHHSSTARKKTGTTKKKTVTKKRR